MCAKYLHVATPCDRHHFVAGNLEDFSGSSPHTATRGATLPPHSGHKSLSSKPTRGNTQPFVSLFQKESNGVRQFYIRSEHPWDETRVALCRSTIGTTPQSLLIPEPPVPHRLSPPTSLPDFPPPPPNHRPTLRLFSAKVNKKKHAPPNPPPPPPKQERVIKERISENK